MATNIVTLPYTKRILKAVLLCFYSRRYGISCRKASSSAFAAVSPLMMQKQGERRSHRDPVTEAAGEARAQLHKHFGWLQDRVPCYGINGNNVTVISDPIDFYETFKGMTKNAKKRILIASLYLGTGTLEEELVQSIESACRTACEAGNEEFEVHVLLDYNRGSRGRASSRTMLLPLLEKYISKVHVYLYHTPDLRGLLKSFLSERFNEIVGLNHMKIYMADDDFIITGANLSDSYFTNRQDRYIQFRQCPEMAEYFLKLIKAVSQFSFHLQKDNTVLYPENTPHPFEGSDPPDVFKGFAKNVIGDMMRSALLSSQSSSQFDPEESTGKDDSDIDTWLFPLIQMGPYGINDDETITLELLQKSEDCDRVLLASGYFNLTNHYMDAILRDSKAKFDILTASPQANGFLGSSGISGYIPDVYTQIAKGFYDQVCKGCQDNRISIHEYHRQHWTFHCKGLWYYVPEYNLPVLTFIGSPNFGYRSVRRDLECQLAVVTTNPALQKQLQKEHKRLYSSALQVSEKTFQQPERYVPLWVRMVTGVLKDYF